MKFNRQYKIFIGDDKSQPMIDGSGTSPLQVVFLVEQVFGGGITYAEINIYNLNPDSRKKLLTRKSRKENRFEDIELWAGYEGDTSMIFKGVIRNAAKKTDGKNQILQLFCRGSGVEYEDRTIEKTWGKQTPAQEVIKDVASAFGLPVSMFGDFSTLPKFMMGYSTSSDVKTELNTLSYSHGFRWDIENKRVIIIKNGETRGRSVLEFDPSSLLMDGTEVTEVGSRITVNLEPSVLTYNKVRIKSESPRISYSAIYYQQLPESVGDGVYKVYALTHKGDLYGSEWSTTMECIRLNQ